MSNPSDKDQDAADRQPHAALDLRQRRDKGMKIEQLLQLDRLPLPLRILEIGTGSGGIAHYFACQSTLHCTVTSIDVVDQRQVTDGYEFIKTEGAELPFDDSSFDVVISNHVIEHVGDREDQLLHLGEIRRVMHDRGVGYLAVPNRWMIVEPHYRLAFLSWWPRGWRTPYLRLMQRGNYYDCEPLQLGELDNLLEQAGLQYEHMEIGAFRKIIEIEGKNNFLARLASHFPDWLLSALRPVIPTLICKLSRDSHPVHERQQGHSSR